MKKNILILTLIFISTTLDIFAQKKQLNHGEFYAPLRVAEEKKFNSSRRETKTSKSYTNGVLKSTKTEIEEFLKPDKQRYFLIENNGDKINKLELIKIGNNYYQKKGDDIWTKESSWGREGGLLAIPIPISSEYTVENTTINNQPAKLYKFFAIYNETEPEEGEETQTYWEQKTWINKVGFEVREEIIVGKPKSKQIISHRIYEQEYNPKIKIEAPIIKVKSKSRKVNP